MPPQHPMAQPAYDDLHAILSHYEAKEAGLGHRIAHRLRDKLQRGTLNGLTYFPNPDRESTFGGEGCLFCTIVQELQGAEPGEETSESPGRTARAWGIMVGGSPTASDMGHAELFVTCNIKAGMTPANSPAADALDAAIEDWLHIQEATLPAHSVKVVAQGWTPRELKALREEVTQ